MIQRKWFFLFVLVTILMQTIFINKFNLLYSGYPFLDGVPATPSESLNYRYLLNWYLPIISMSFFFTGYLKDTIYTYGPSFFIRSYSKPKWVMKRLCYLAVILGFFVLFQWMLSIVTIQEWTFPAFALLAYFLTLYLLFSMQLLLELYLKSEIAQLVINIYIVFSILVSSHLDSSLLGEGNNYFFVPLYGMGFRNGLSDIIQFQTHDIHLFSGFVILIVLLLGVALISMLKVKKMDLLR